MVISVEFMWKKTKSRCPQNIETSAFYEKICNITKLFYFVRGIVLSVVL